MIKKTYFSWLLVGLMLVAVGLVGCDEGDSQENDTCGETDLYPEGNYGFKPAIRLVAGQQQWTEDGDTLPDMCLPNEDGEEVCMHEFYRESGVDIIVLDISAQWCGPCKAAAADEKAALEMFAERGWNLEWITVLAEGSNGGTKPSLETISAWREETGNEGIVLADTNHEWYSGYMYDKAPGEGQRAFPNFFFIDPNNMLVGALRGGWEEGKPLDFMVDAWIDRFEQMQLTENLCESEAIPE